uniref:Uncharacterized protein n=1 Tax=Mus musculus TaxID=10090 RepID=Q3TZ00_MOUSE|nr:unnamed protein product [Mus musculus]
MFKSVRSNVKRSRTLILLEIKIFNSPSNILFSSEGATDNGSLVSDDSDLQRISLDLNHLLGHLAGGDNKAGTELASKILHGLTNYNETNLATNQNCTNVTALPLLIILEVA